MRDPAIKKTVFKNPRRIPRIRIKCACCKNHVDIFADDLGLEINGVNGSKKFWRNSLLKL